MTWADPALGIAKHVSESTRMRKRVTWLSVDEAGR
jgi:hypothetical protein